MGTTTSVRSRRGARAWAAAGLGAALLLSGCGGGPAEESDAGPEDVGPLGEYFEQLYPEQSDEETTAQMREVEELTAACMQEQGFEYTPMDVSSMVSDVDVDMEDVDYDSEEYVATHGYDITTSMQETEADPPVDEDEWVDPNEDYVATMSENEQNAFYEALYGPMEEFDESDPEAEAVEYDWSTAGCSGEAQHEADGGMVDPYADPAFASLQEEMDRMYTSVEDSPELSALDAEWASCMADAGYPGYTTQQDAWDDISARNDELYSATTETSPEPDAAATEELQQVEIDTALADFHCKEDLRFDETYAEVSTKAEEEFVEAHRAELDAWVEAAGQEP